MLSLCARAPLREIHSLARHTMNVILFANVESTWLLVGWTMVHFLWQGTLVALAALLSRWLLRRASANVRYVTALACLTTLAALPVATAIWLHQNPASFQVKDSLSQEEGGGGFAAAQKPIANPTAAPIIDLAKQETIPANATLKEPAQLTTHVEAKPLLALTTTPSPSTERDPLSVAIFAIDTSVQYLPWLW